VVIQAACGGGAMDWNILCACACHKILSVWLGVSIAICITSLRKEGSRHCTLCQGLLLCEKRRLRLTSVALMPPLFSGHAPSVGRSLVSCTATYLKSCTPHMQPLALHAPSAPRTAHTTRKLLPLTTFLKRNQLSQSTTWPQPWL